jgi:hypothetical protein
LLKPAVVRKHEYVDCRDARSSDDGRISGNRYVPTELVSVRCIRRAERRHEPFTIRVGQSLLDAPEAIGWKLTRRRAAANRGK